MVEITRSERMATSTTIFRRASPGGAPAPRRAAARTAGAIIPQDPLPARSLATRLEVRRGGLSYHELRARRRPNLGRDGRDLVEHGGLVEGQDPAVAERPRPVDHDRGHGRRAGLLA